MYIVPQITEISTNTKLRSMILSFFTLLLSLVNNCTSLSTCLDCKEGRHSNWLLSFHQQEKLQTRNWASYPSLIPKLFGTHFQPSDALGIEGSNKQDRPTSLVWLAKTLMADMIISSLSMSEENGDFCMHCRTSRMSPYSCFTASTRDTSQKILPAESL